MSTANGLPRLKVVRQYARTLEERIDYLQEKIAAKVATHEDFHPEWSFEAAEIAALRHALDLLDAEWDNLARLRRNVAVLANRQGAAEGRGTPENYRWAEGEWEQPNPG